MLGLRNPRQAKLRVPEGLQKHPADRTRCLAISISFGSRPHEHDRAKTMDNRSGIDATKRAHVAVSFYVARPELCDGRAIKLCHTSWTCFLNSMVWPSLRFLALGGTTQSFAMGVLLHEADAE